MIAGAAFGAGETAGDPIHQHVILHAQFDDRIQRHAMVR